MARKLRASTPQSTVYCGGGQSLNCARPSHVQGRYEVTCFRCKTRMGCSFCCESARELICLVCHNWAAKKALKIHGNVIANSKVRHVRTDDGRHEPHWEHWREGDEDVVAKIEKLL